MGYSRPAPKRSTRFERLGCRKGDVGLGLASLPTTFELCLWRQVAQDLTSHLSASENNRVFGGGAAEFYRLAVWADYYTDGSKSSGCSCSKGRKYLINCPR